jgi:hypothetical protein
MKLRNMASMIIIDYGKILLLHKQPKFSDRSLWLARAGGHFEHTEMNAPDTCLSIIATLDKATIVFT